METPPTPPEENRKRRRQINSDSSVSSGESLPSRKAAREGQDDYEGEFMTTVVPAMPMAVQEITCAQINEMFNSLVNGPGQDDMTDVPSAAASRARAELSELGNAINALIVQREQRQLEIQRQAAEQTAAEMREIEASQIVEENTRFINDVVGTMIRSQQRLERPERIALNRRIIQLINDSVTNSEVRRQLEAEGIAGANIRGLFDAIIKYCTAMASYSYNSAPTIIANLGSILAGSSIIAGTVCGIGSMNNTGGSLLVFLSQLLQTGSSTAVGLYFLGRGGLPVQRMLQGIGATTVDCLRDACIRVRNQGQQFMNSISQTFNEMLEADTISSESSDSSVSTASTAGSAVTAISGILSMPIDTQIALLENGDFDARDESLAGREVVINEVDVDEPLTQPSAFGSQTDMNAIDGGRKRKSRRHMKMRRTRKGRKGRRGKVRMTKKGRKHHRTMKRYRSKGHR